MAWTDNNTATGSASRLGQKGGANDVNALFLRQFAGEVLTSFEEKNIAMPLHRVRTIKNGRSAQFPSIGTIGANYHTAGTQVFGDKADHGEITVTVDDLLLSAAFIPKIDEAINHYEVRSTYSKEMGNALANAADRNIFSMIYQSATGAAVTNGDASGYWTEGDFASLSDSDNDDGGSAAGTAGVINLSGAADDSASGAFTAANFVDSVFAALQKFDEHDVGGEKYLVVTPKAYYTLFGASADLAVMNRDFAGTGSAALGQAPTIGGVKVLMSNHLPTADNSTPDPLANTAGSGNAGKYRGAGTYNAALQGLIFTKDAAATVKLMDLGVESEYQIDRQGTLMVAKYAMGHNRLRGKSAIALVS